MWSENIKAIAKALVSKGINIQGNNNLYTYNGRRIYIRGVKKTEDYISVISMEYLKKTDFLIFGWKIEDGVENGEYILCPYNTEDLQIIKKYTKSKNVNSISHISIMKLLEKYKKRLENKISLDELAVEMKKEVK